MQFKSDLNATEWTALGDPVSAVGDTALKTDQNNGSQRFYRVVLLQ